MPSTEKNRVARFILFWTGINLVMSLLWALEVSYFYNVTYLESIWPTLIRVYCISSLSPLCGVYAERLFSSQPLWLKYLVIVFASVVGAIAGVFLSGILVHRLFINIDSRLGDSMERYTLVAGVITSIIVSLITTTIGLLIEKNRNYERRLKNLNQPVTPEYITFKNRDIRNKVKIEEIMYLTSTGKHTILHTLNGDIEIPLLLKDAAASLPPSMFLRIHKKHLVNIRKISGLRHVHGGSYQLSLNDDEESEIPVGRKYLLEIQRLFTNEPAHNKLDFQDT